MNCRNELPINRQFEKDKDNSHEEPTLNLTIHLLYMPIPPGDKNGDAFVQGIYVGQNSIKGEKNHHQRNNQLLKDEDLPLSEEQDKRLYPVSLHPLKRMLSTDKEKNPTIIIPAYPGIFNAGKKKKHFLSEINLATILLQGK